MDVGHQPKGDGLYTNSDHQRTDAHTNGGKAVFRNMELHVLANAHNQLDEHKQSKPRNKIDGGVAFQTFHIKVLKNFN